MRNQINSFILSLVGRTFGNFTFINIDSEIGTFGLNLEDVISIGVNPFYEDDETISVVAFDYDSEWEVDEYNFPHELPTNDEELEAFKKHYISLLEVLADKYCDYENDVIKDGDLEDIKLW